MQVILIIFIGPNDPILFELDWFRSNSNGPINFHPFQYKRPRLNLNQSWYSDPSALWDPNKNTKLQKFIYLYFISFFPMLPSAAVRPPWTQPSAATSFIFRKIVKNYRLFLSRSSKQIHKKLILIHSQTPYIYEKSNMNLHFFP